jgi:hypothetical protein
MPLRQLNDKGQPKLDKELSRDEQAGRFKELEEDKRMQVARAHREIADRAVLEQAEHGRAAR